MQLLGTRRAPHSNWIGLWWNWRKLEAGGNFQPGGLSAGHRLSRGRRLIKIRSGSDVLIMDNTARSFFVDGSCVVADNGRGACTGENDRKI
jgi:hypothetical protein